MDPSDVCVSNMTREEMETVVCICGWKRNNSTSHLRNLKNRYLNPGSSTWCSGGVLANEHAQHDTRRLRLTTQPGFTFTNLYKVLIKALLMAT